MPSTASLLAQDSSVEASREARQAVYNRQLSRTGAGNAPHPHGEHAADSRTCGDTERCRSGQRPDVERHSGSADAAGCPAAHAADARPAHAGLRRRHGAARRDAAAHRRRGQLHRRPHAQSRARDAGAGRRATGDDLQPDDELGGQQDLPGHRARPGNVRHAGPERPREADRDDQPPRTLHAEGRRLRSEAVRARHGRAVHRRRRRARSVAVHDARQPDRAEARARHDRDLDRQRQRRRTGQPARARIRHDVGPLRGVRRDRSAAAGREASAT